MSDVTPTRDELLGALEPLVVKGNPEAALYYVQLMAGQTTVQDVIVDVRSRVLEAVRSFQANLDTLRAAGLY